MALFSLNLCLLLVCVLSIVGQANAFGAGNIASLSRIEGQNWRHGDIEDALLTLFMARVAGGHKFSKLDVKRVYFGNWLRDYSQAVDVGTVKYVSAEAIRILIWVLGFMSFGYGTREFEVTTDRLGCYEPTEHIDNPLGYAEGDDARRYDRRLRGPVDEERELSIDPRTGLKSYIASEDLGIATSAGLIRRVFGRSVELGRRYARSRDKEDLYEALRLLGTGLHCLEDYAAHSNYTELSLIELGESEVFPHVGRNTKLEVEGARDYVYPIVTGTFGGVDFFHSVLGEISDKATQSELQSLENVITESQSGEPSRSLLQDLLNKVPEGLIGDSDNQADKMDEFKAKAEDAKHHEHISPREPEQWTEYLNDVQQQIYPVLEWHDELLKSINEAIEKIPVLPDLIEQIQDQITVFVYSVLAPYVLPIIQQIKAELETGSSEVIQSSREQQHIVFDNDDCSDPTHSMLSKDHFSNILNEPAGRIASQVVKWTVPQLMECWDNEDVDIDRTLDRIVSGVFHHPALRDYGEDGAADVRQIMFKTVEEWWNAKGEEEQEGLRRQLSREGVRRGENHKPGVHDSGHGCGKPLTLHQGRNTFNQSNRPDTTGIGKVAEEAVGGGALGSLVGGLVGGVSSMLLNDTTSTTDPPMSDFSKYEGGRPSGQAYMESSYSSGHHRFDDGRQYGSESYTASYSEYENRADNQSQQFQREENSEYGYAKQRDDRPPAQQWRRDEYNQYQSGDGDGYGGDGYGRHSYRELQEGYEPPSREYSRPEEPRRGFDGGRPFDDNRVYSNHRNEYRSEQEFVPSYSDRQDREPEYGYQESRRDFNDSRGEYGEREYGREERHGSGSESTRRYERHDSSDDDGDHHGHHRHHRHHHHGRRSDSTGSDE